MALTPTTGSSLTPMQAPDASSSTQATPVTSTKPVRPSADMEALLSQAQPAEGVAPPRKDITGQKAARTVRYGPPDFYLGSGFGYEGTPQPVEADWSQAVSRPAYEAPLPPLAPATATPRPAVVDNEMMLAAQILSDEDYAAYLRERRAGGQQR